MSTPTPCTYRTAHKRLRAQRGPASAHTCPCGAPAEQWAYRGTSPLEQTGTTTLVKRGRRYEARVSWSPDPADYDALCVTCHFARDLTPEKRQAKRERALSNPPKPARINGAQVAILAMCGLGATDIGRALDVSKATVYAHRDRHMATAPRRRR